MSAFVVDKHHIDVLVRTALGGPETRGHRWTWAQWKREDASDIGQMLADANARSVRARYSDADEAGMVPYFVLEGYEYAAQTRPVSTVQAQALKALRCFEYQSCETSDWTDSDACGFCQQLTALLIAALPGYEDAQWELDGSPVLA